MAQSVNELTKLIESACEQLLKKQNFNISTYLDGLSNKYKTEIKHFDDEKKETQKISLSLLTNKNEQRMCKRGHSLTAYPKKMKCNQCGMDAKSVCYSCHNFERAYTPDIYDKFALKHFICGDCGFENSEKVKKLVFEKEQKEKEIIAYYDQNPHMAVDLLCNLNTKPALEYLLKEIVVSAVHERRGYCLWSFDIDNFKDLNETLGHDGADIKLKEIGKILKSFTQKSETFWKEKGITITRIWTFRPGGDEFCMVTKSEKEKIKSQKGFYELLKQEINGIGINISVGLLVNGAYLTSCIGTNWLKLADKALYKAKHIKGKNTLRIWDGYQGKIVEIFEDVEIGAF